MGNDAQGSNRRRILIVDKEFQNKFMAKFFGMVVAGTVITGAIVYLFCRSTVTTVFKDSRLKIMSTADFIFPVLVLSAVLVILVVGTATVLIALYVSHRIAGPVYRLRQDVLSFNAGNFRQIFRLRDKDEMKPLAQALNEMARKLQNDLTLLKAETEALEKASADLPSLLKERLKNIKKVLDHYHV